jgi:hypothetical protein
LDGAETAARCWRGRELVTLEDAASYSNATANRSKLTHVPITGAFQTRETKMKNLVVVAAFAAFSFSPASAKMMACTGENLAKMTDHLATMPQTPKRTAMMREIAMVNTGMSNGNMRGACTHYMIAQRIQNDVRDPFGNLHFE